MFSQRVAPNGRPVARRRGPYTGRGAEHGWAVRRQDPLPSMSNYIILDPTPSHL